ncbi:MAG: hypothetical protein EXR28_00470 [Betaproteobacteria bacterium]|nr:hypothetical protein [Betaproteobacteria bacterium]
MSLPEEIELLSRETGMVFTQPEGFTPIAVTLNEVWAYHHAVLSPSCNLEIRYRIDSLPRLAAQRAGLQQGMTLVASVETNEIYRANAAATLFNLSGGQDRPFNPFPAEAVRAEFGADWGAIADFLLPQRNPDDGYRVGLLIALHRDNRADAYVLGLMRKPGVEFDLLRKNFYSLTFIQKIIHPRIHPRRQE